MTAVVTDCPEWEYDKVAGFKSILAARAKSLLVPLRSGNPDDVMAVSKDTRPLHGVYFSGLTPPGFDYYGGHFRGEDFLCLLDYEVQIRSDHRVGHPPRSVPDKMAALATDIDNAIQECDIAWGVPNVVFSPAEKLIRIVRVAAAIFVYFLEIHPYANGNGHMARFILIALLARYRVYPARWPIHPRPADPPYSELIARYRSGEKALFERFVLECI